MKPINCICLSIFVLFCGVVILHIVVMCKHSWYFNTYIWSLHTRYDHIYIVNYFTIWLKTKVPMPCRNKASITVVCCNYVLANWIHQFSTTPSTIEEALYLHRQNSACPVCIRGMDKYTSAPPMFLLRVRWIRLSVWFNVAVRFVWKRCFVYRCISSQLAVHSDCSISYFTGFKGIA